MVDFGKGHHQGLCFGDRVVCSIVHSFCTGFGGGHQNSHQIVVAVVDYPFLATLSFTFFDFLVMGTGLNQEVLSPGSAMVTSSKVGISTRFLCRFKYC